MFIKTSAAFLAMTILGAGAACAHPRLQESVPARDAKLSSAPREIRMSFSEALIANFTGLELKNGKGKTVATGKAMLVSGDSKKLVVPIATRLNADTYTVAWHAVSVDTHRVSGTYSFQIVK
jgi:methionine-rich copper-binding protein CopC